MFWAREKHKKRMARRRAESWAEVLAKSKADDKPEIAAWLEQAAREQGVALREPLER